MADIKISGLTPKGSALGPNDLLEVSVFQGLNYVTRSIKGEDIIAASSGSLHVPIKPLTNQLVSLNITGESNSILSSFPNNSLMLYPFVPGNLFVLDQIQINVTTPVPGGLVKILFYSDSDGLPVSKSSQSANLDCSTIGLKTYSLVRTLYPGSRYWIAINTNNALINFESIEDKNLASFGVLSNNKGITAYKITANFGSEPSILSGITTTNQVNSAAPLFYIRST